MSEYKNLLQQKAELDARIAEVMKTEKTGAVVQARTLIQEYQLTEQDLFPKANSKAAASAGTPKYRDPATGTTWTGRGKPPNWILGKDRTAYEI